MRLHLGVLGLGDVDEDLSSGVDDIKQLHDGGAVVGDSGGALVIVDELVHAPGAQSRPHGVGHRRAGVDIGNHLRLPLGRVRALLQKYDLRLLQSLTKQESDQIQPSSFEFGVN